jgi:hypothetical protein
LCVNACRSRATNTVASGRHGERNGGLRGTVDRVVTTWTLGTAHTYIARLTRTHIGSSLLCITDASMPSTKYIQIMVSHECVGRKALHETTCSRTNPARLTSKSLRLRAAAAQNRADNRAKYVHMGWRVASWSPEDTYFRTCAPTRTEHKLSDLLPRTSCVTIRAFVIASNPLSSSNAPGHIHKRSNTEYSPVARITLAGARSAC